MSSDAAEWRRRVGSTGWYHTFDLPGGVTTPGLYDLRKVVGKVLPDDLSGKRCLDAATSSGFWAFEMERRGAKEVVAIDLPDLAGRDWQYPWAAPTGERSQLNSFDIAQAALDSKVQRKLINLYDVSREDIGAFDFVFIGSVLLHLRDPVRALRALQTVTSGELLSFEPILYWTSMLRRRTAVGRMATTFESRWWTPSVEGHKQWLRAAGFEIVEASGSVIFQPFGAATKSWRKGSLRHRIGAGLFGVPSAWVRAEPRAS